MRNLIYGLLLFGLIATVVQIGKCTPKKELPIPIEECSNVDSLTEWQVFIMALVEVECERNPNVTSSKGAIGPFQVTKSYVKEINRLYNTEFTLEDAWDLDKSLEMFEMMNDHYNVSRDIDKAIKLHNPGAGKWYMNRIKKRMELIRFNEQVRFKIVELYNKI